MADSPLGPIAAPIIEQCVYKAPSALNITLACILMIGAIVAFTPQIVAVVRLKTSEGVSVSALALGFIASTFVMINKFILSWHALECCSTTWTAAECGGHNLAVWQTIVTPVGIFVTTALVLHYFPLETTKEATHEQHLKQKRIGIAMFVGVVIICIIVAAIAAIMRFVAGVQEEPIRVYAQVIGISAAVSVVLHWGPQIWHTAFVVKSTKSFSVLSLAFQMPGTFLIVIFQGIVNHADWSSWVPSFVSGIEQAILAAICLFFMWKEWKESKNKPEVSPLLPESPAGSTPDGRSSPTDSPVI